MTPTATLRLAAPAKVNLGLWVGPLRPDGFHEVVTTIVPLRFGDTVSVRLTRSGVVVQTDDPRVPDGPDNLAHLAARLLLRAARSRAGCTVRIRKRIPPGSGLGGGSSDAAAVLRGLNRLLGEPVSRPALFRLALHIGSDVPALLLGRPCVARGRGERVRSVSLPALRVVLCLAGFPVATGSAYAWLDRARARGLTEPVPSPKILAARLRQGELERAASLLSNSFEPVVSGRHPRLRRARQLLLDSGCVAAGLSGSGSTVYGLAPEPGRGDPMAALDRHGFRAIVTRSIPCPDRSSER
jgi:4-diphosphocytidyl-2-C-methyl-D-erythritol kinase